jgi:salicylate hydroxylase
VAGAADRDTAAWLGPGAHLVTYPLDRSGTLNLVALTHGRAAEGWSEPGDREELMRAFKDWAPKARSLVSSAQSWVKWPLYDGAPARGSGPVTLIGDAAHPVLPHAAQGAAMAIEDAAVLAARIAEMPDALPRAFRAYEEARAARTARVQDEARRNGAVFRLGGPAAIVRDAALRLIGPERQMARLDWLYGHRAT